MAPGGVDGQGKGTLVGASTRVRSIEGGNRTVQRTYESMKHIARVKVVSRNAFRYIVRNGKSTLPGAGAGARSVEGCDGAIWRAQEAVIHTACVAVGSRHHPSRVDGPGKRTLTGAGAGARGSPAAAPTWTGTYCQKFRFFKRVIC